LSDFADEDLAGFIDRDEDPTWRPGRGEEVVELVSEDSRLSSTSPVHDDWRLLPEVADEDLTEFAGEDSPISSTFVDDNLVSLTGAGNTAF
jgi:hypothetical protein